MSKRQRSQIPAPECFPAPLAEPRPCTDEERAILREYARKQEARWAEARRRMVQRRAVRGEG